jgi:hypothetical protein
MQRIHEFDSVLRAICEELHLCYGGVDTEDAAEPILAAIRNLKHDLHNLLTEGATGMWVCEHYRGTHGVHDSCRGCQNFLKVPSRTVMADEFGD